jgi:2-polyprenyl-3-methyl-5-hydroxy-6-metoxy-1,4-benzoquinol methylase
MTQTPATHPPHHPCDGGHRPSDLQISAGHRTVDAVAEQVFQATLGAMELLSIYIGDRLGWYDSLRRDGAATAVELARRTATSPRYAEEWLQQQAVVGLVHVDTSGSESRFTLPSASEEVLTDIDSLSYLSPAARMIAASAMRLPQLLDAYRTGDGVSWDELGDDARQGQAAINRPWFLHALAGALGNIDDLDLLLRRPGIRILDVGCGAGWSSIALAAAYPTAMVVGIDQDAPSVQLARHHAAAHGIGTDRLTFRIADAATVSGKSGEKFDIAFAFECVHDLSRPVEVLAAVRNALRPGGTLVVMDEAVNEDFSAAGGEIEKFMYGFSLLVCLPDGMSSAPSEATGTVMRPAVLRRYAERAGFKTVDVLPIRDFAFFRFYRLN